MTIAVKHVQRHLPGILNLYYRFVVSKITHKFQGLIYLHLFVELFHKDFSSIIRRNTRLKRLFSDYRFRSCQFEPNFRNYFIIDKWQSAGCVLPVTLYHVNGHIALINLTRKTVLHILTHMGRPLMLCCLFDFKAFQWHAMSCHDLEVMGSNPTQFGICSPKLNLKPTNLNQEYNFMPTSWQYILYISIIKDSIFAFGIWA